MNNEGMVCHIKGHIRTSNISELNNEGEEGGGCTEESGSQRKAARGGKKSITREDKGVRELVPHIGATPIPIPLKLFLEGIEFRG